MAVNTQRHILVGTHHLEHVGGSELYTIDLLKTLQRRDDVTVEYFALKRGKLAQYIEESLGIRYTSRNQYDLILASHNVVVDALRKHGQIVQICHGTIPPLEQPFPYADYHIGISDEVCNHLKNKGYNSKLILNGLDLNQKKPVRTPNTELKTVLSLCQSEEAKALLTRVCERAGLTLIHHSKHKNPTLNIEQEINQADMVVGIGRSVYDAMACGRPCIVFDNRDYNGNKGDGYLHPHLFDQYVQTNCSGRYRDLAFDEERLLREFAQYRAEDGAKLRHIAEEKLDVRKTASELLNTHQYMNARTKLAKWKRVAAHRCQRIKRSIQKRMPRLGAD